ncbi:MAG: segregation/condensation protein A [Patescibacteria group bacterium]|nr:segregation/condensation protein A [Patescibacteria group bacterium]
MTFVSKINKFEGPLDLLLQLIEAADLDITEVSIADVAEQFMAYLAAVEEKNPEELADFLVVATKLLLIKSRVLLPNVVLDEEGEGDDLARQLKMYKEYLDASKKIEQILLDKNILFAREKIPLDIEAVFNPPKNMTAEKLKTLLIGLIAGMEPFIRLPQKSLERAVSIKEKIEQIRNKILNKINTSFRELVGDSKNRTDLIVTFLGLLELVKQRTIVVKQDKMFDDISVSRLNTD